MLDLFYSPESLEAQMLIKKHQFILVELDEEPVGFASFSHTESTDIYKLHKLYVLPEIQGKGLGKALLDFIIQQLKTSEARLLLLNVNRQNRARSFYEKLGFTVIKEEDVDIGNNYFMNDYVMERKL